MRESLTLFKTEDDKIFHTSLFEHRGGDALKKKKKRGQDKHLTVS